MPDARWINWLELRLGRFAIPGLIRIVVGFNILVFALLEINPAFVNVIDLQPNRVLTGEVWRLFTYVFIPQVIMESASRYILMFISALFLWFIGDSLEAAWGSFRLNLFYILGMVGCTIAAFIFGGGPTNAYLNASLFFAFATLFPDHTILFMWILPMKVKWIAWVQAALLAVAFTLGSAGAKAVIFISFMNYLLFFGPYLVVSLKTRGEVAARRSRFESAKTDESEPLHKCKVCGRDDLSHPELEFRVASDGEDYCNEHQPTGSPAH